MYNKASVGSGGSRVVAKSASTAFKNKGNNFSVLNQSLIALRGQLFVPDRCLKALELDTALGLIKRNFKNITGPSDERPAASAAPFAIIRVRRWGSVSLVYPAVVSSPPLFLLLLRVLAQQGPHLILVIKWTGTESGLQPSSVLCDSRRLILLQLLLEAVVGADEGADSLDCGQTLLPAVVSDGHQVGHHHCGAAGDACQAVHKTGSTIQAAFVDEANALFKMLRKVLAGSISCMNTEIFFVLKDGLGIVIHGEDVSDAILRQTLLVFCISYVSKVESIDNLVHSIAHDDFKSACGELHVSKRF